MTEDVLAAYQAHQKALTETMLINKTAVFAALATASITKVMVIFDGGGDSGQINEVLAKNGDTPVDLPETQVEFQQIEWNGRKAEPSKCTLRDAIEALCFNYLSHEHGGWENNDGGQGEFSFDVAAEQIDLEFEQFYTDSTTHTHTF